MISLSTIRVSLAGLSDDEFAREVALATRADFDFRRASDGREEEVLVAFLNAAWTERPEAFKKGVALARAEYKKDMERNRREPTPHSALGVPAVATPLDPYAPVPWCDHRPRENMPIWDNPPLLFFPNGWGTKCYCARCGECRPLPGAEPNEEMPF